MSFASEIKKDLARIKSESKKCQKSELSGIIRTSGQIHLRGNNKTDLTIKSENPAVARLVFSLLKKTFGIRTEIEAVKNFRNKKKHFYIIKINDSTELLEKLYIFDNSQGYYQISNQIHNKLLEDRKVKRTYLRGLFLGGGSVNDPNKSYHLEVNVHNEVFAKALNRLMHSFDLNSKVIQRKDTFVIYIKESAHIIKFLNLIGAHKALLEFENVRTLKEIRNKVNRIVNCETANLTKTVDAAMRHIASIDVIEAIKGLDYLGDQLKELAILRKKNREASLSELGEMLSKPLSKSSVNYRLKKIEKIAKELRRDIDEGSIRNKK